MAKLNNKKDTKFITNISTIISVISLLAIASLVVILYTNGTLGKWFNDGKYYVSTLKNGETVEVKLMTGNTSDDPKNIVFKNPNYIVFYGEDSKDTTNLQGSSTKTLKYFKVDGDKVGVLMTPQQAQKFSKDKTYYMVLKDSILFSSKDKEGIKRLKEDKKEPLKKPDEEN